MANPGVGSKFVSVNLNKSYGQRSTSSANLGGGTNRNRSIIGGGNGVGGGSGSGMVVLSRSRSSIVGVQKGGPKLSVPPPLNLPSLRKEHERFDSSSSGGGSAGAGNPGAGTRPASSGIGWTKPAPVLQEKDIGNDQPLFERSGVGSPRINGSDSLDRASRGNSVYMPPSARSLTTGPSVAAPSHDYQPVHRAVVLRGEDFPSLQATLPTASGIAQKQKDSLTQKQNQKASGEHDEQLGNSYLRPPFVMHPQNQSSRLIGKTSDDKEGVNDRSGGSRDSERLRKQDDFFPSPLPHVRLNTSDWADDERDTGHGLPDRDRDQGYSRNEFLRDRDFDFPRSSVPPRTLIRDHSEGRGLRHDEVGRPSSGGFSKGNAYNRDVRSPSREGRDGSSWRPPSLMKDGFSADRNSIGARPLGLNRENGKENKYGQSPFGESAQDGFSSGFPGNQDSRFGRRDMAYGQGTRQTGNRISEGYNGRGIEQTKPDYYGSDVSNRHRGDSFHNGSSTKTSGKGFANDPVLGVGREKRLTGGKQYLEESFLKDFGSGSDFDGRDPLDGTLVGVVKRKKEVMKQVDYHDPVRESFEAELERVQKLQEQERRRVIEEQARALELARKEEEERERVAREEEERRRRLEEEVREAAWRAEQEHLEAMRRAEEQKVAREEEKRRMLLEEERRKEAARKKLMELEARIARRQAEGMRDTEFPSTVRDERMHGVFQEKDVQRVADIVDWEDGERMVERITSSASSDSSSLNRSFEMGSRPHFYRDGDPAFLDRGKSSSSWRRDVFDAGNSSSFIWQDQENGYRSPKRDAYGMGRAFTRKEFNGGPGTMPTKPSARGGFPEPLTIDDFPHPRGNRWNLAGDGDLYSRNPDIDPEFHDNFADKFSDMGWGLGRPRVSHHASYPERLYQNSDNEGFSSFGKSRHSMRQPRVLPPPTVAAMNKNAVRSQIDTPTSPVFHVTEMSYHQTSRKSESILQMEYEGSYQEEIDKTRLVDSRKDNTSSHDQKVDDSTTLRCDSQSSLSVSSPPSSPTHLSHDDLDDSGESPTLPTAAEDEEVHLSDNEHAGSVAEVRSANKVGDSSSLSPEEDEEWDTENHRDLAEQEEYDEEENGYREEDEVHEGDDENVDLRQESEDVHLEEKDPSSKKDQLVFGFDGSADVVATPSADDLERKTSNEDTVIEAQKQIPAGVSEAAESQDGLVGIEKTLQSGNNSPKMSVENSGVTQEAEKKIEDLGIQSVSAINSSDGAAAYLADSIDTSSASTRQFHPPVASTMDTALPSSTTQPTVSTVSASPSQTEVPVKLQFGLFSGPSLIPSPVSPIQIGSIPLHVHHQVGPSLAQLHPSQPPFFQFGQLRYASPISQGILPLGPQSMSFVQSSVPCQFPFNQNQNGSSNHQEGQDSRIQNHSAQDKLAVDVLADKQTSVQKHLEQSQEDPREEVNMLSVRQGIENDVMVSHSRADSTFLGEKNMRSETSSVQPGYQYFDGRRNYRSTINNRDFQSQLRAEPTSSQFIPKAPGPNTGNKGKRHVYAVKNSGQRSSLPYSESPHADSKGFPRRARPRFQFRVRETIDKRQNEGSVSSNYAEPEKSSFSGRSSGTSYVNKISKQMVEGENLDPETISSVRDGGSESKMEKQLDREVKKGISLYGSHSREGNPKQNNSFDEDVDAPLQSGIVRVFKQPGIEAPSDEDDFIEVRSKRQMLNDRREQREKENKAKARIIKAPKKRRSVSQNNFASTISNKTSMSMGRETSNSTYSKSVINDGKSLERPTRFANSVVSPPLAPIGTPSVNNDAHADIRSYTTKSPQSGSIPLISTNGTSLGPSLSFENKNVSLDAVPTSLSPWGNSRMNQQVMALTQTQLDEAMKPARFEKHVASIGDRSSAVLEHNKLPSSIVAQDKSFSSTASPLNSLLAGEKIQFGAVTSPTILPPSSHVASNGMGLSDSYSEAEAEAAASAVAVAAISSDEIVGSGCAVTVSEIKSFPGAENEGLVSEGGVSNQQSRSQSRVEESLSVALPADLSVETPSLSLWPSLPSPQHSSGQMLSHFPGGPPSHFPCYEMNPMFGGPIFALGPHDDNAGSHSQSQKSSASGPGPLGAWQQCHSGVDSFYGPPAGFTGPFISPSGGIPGVQGPPHMVVYNHFTPVGQFGQVGLSFMGATYIPSGKQPDWKHNPASTAMGISEGDINNLNVPASQHNPPNMPPIQHLAPGSPLLPMASPLAMFDMSPFQASGDVSVQARWSHFSASPLHSAPLSMPLPQQVDGVLPSQFSHVSSIDQSTGSRFHDPSTTSENNRNFSVETSGTATQFPDELGLLDTSSTTTAAVSTSRPASYSSTIMNGKAKSIVAKNVSRGGANAGDSSSINNNGNQSINSSAKSKTYQGQQQASSGQQYRHSTAYNDQRVSQKMTSGSEWSHHRRTGFQARNQSSGTDKKVKQVYVAKPATTSQTPPV